MYHLVTFAIVAIAAILAIIFWSRGLVILYGGREKARDQMTAGLMIGVWGVALAAIVFGVFNL